MPKKSWSIISDGVFLYTSRETDHAGAPVAIYEVECAQLQNLSFEIDISLSHNFKLENSSEKKVQITVGPYHRVLVARLVTVDASKRSVLKIQYKWKLSEPLLSEEENATITEARDSAVKVSFKHSYSYY